MGKTFVKVDRSDGIQRNFLILWHILEMRAWIDPNDRLGIRL